MKKIMAKIVLLIILASMLTTSISAPDAWKEGKDVIHVGGKVLCQDCTEGWWNQSVNGTKALKGCKVSVTCLDDRSRVVYYGSNLTDEAGDFDMIINKYVNGKMVNAKNCFLRLVSSPDPVCNVATDFAGGKTGVKLHQPTLVGGELLKKKRPTLVYRDITKYILGPFYYTTPMCDEPDTTTNDDSDDDAKEINY